MARRAIKFPLKMNNGAEVRSIEELRENADLESLMRYYFSGQLSLWCRAYSYTEIPESISEINETFVKKICDLFDIRFSDDEIQEYLKKCFGSSELPTFSAVSTQEVVDNKEIKSKLREYVDSDTDLDEILIEVSPENDENGEILKYRIIIENEKTEQYTKFCLPYNIVGEYTNTNFEEDLYKKIAFVLEKMKEEYLYFKLKNSRYAGLKKDDIFEFGKYDHQPIKWRVLLNNGKKLLSISDEVICKKRFDDNFPYRPNWVYSSLREWLNEEFYKSSFDIIQRKLIEKSFYKCNEEKLSDYFFLGTENQLSNLFDTEKKRGCNESYWLRDYWGGGEIRIIRTDGSSFLANAGTYSRGSSIAIHGVRPLFWLKY